MNEADWLEVQVEVAAAVGEVGSTAAFVKSIKQSGGDPFDPTYVDAAYSVTAFQSGWSQSEIDGSRIRANDKRFMVAAQTGFLPDDTYRINVGGTLVADGESQSGYVVSGGVQYEIVNIDPFQPDMATVIYYDVQAR